MEKKAGKQLERKQWHLGIGRWEGIRVVCQWLVGMFKCLHEYQTNTNGLRQASIYLFIYLFASVFCQFSSFRELLTGLSMYVVFGYVRDLC